ncbi:NRAMP family divalent metal transporter [Noviherbaspirillum sp. Root189]|uniref:NRAMP family divalent metal transporter n=1 Tax=Noviherbaspirillum sp. Root189 TaxID=1736487 RepID=UPI00070BDA9A|nr:divalent metal cation transporter [Noviherbaspirillum sp. Root189]KRB93800.1 iron transporter [Noviherbaspirillum sp. Root189]
MQHPVSGDTIVKESPSLPWYKKLGPGLITGAADDDPSGIATYSQGGAQFGYNLLWTLLFTYPLMVGIQIVSARIGRVTGEGLAANIRRCYSPWLLYLIVSMLVIANTINIGADIAAMADAVRLVVGGPHAVYVVGFGALSVLLQVFIPYKRYVHVLKWLTLALFAYVGVVFFVHISWGDVLRRVVVPHITFSKEYVTAAVAILGTTISPYLFFWQASQEVEEVDADPYAHSLRTAPEQARAHLRRISIDTYIGMGISNLIAFFIMLTTATTLFQHGMRQIQTSAQAAEALRPIAGEFAFLLFSCGVIGTGMLAIPVLAGSAAYAVAGAFGWRKGLDLKLAMGKRFYGIIAASTLMGAVIGMIDVDPIKALFWAAVINGVISVPIMVVMMLMAQRRDIMGPFVVTRKLKYLGWSATAAMAAAVIILFVTSWG